MLSRQADVDDASEYGEERHFLSEDGGNEDGRVHSTTSSVHEKMSHHRPHALKNSRYQTLLICAIIFPLGAVLGSAITYIASTRPSMSPHYGGLLPPAGSVSEVWQHNLTFSQAPTPESEAAWTSVVPVGRGFIHQPDIAPFISNIAAFHQLHCLHAILVAYYAAVNSSGDPEQTIELFGTRIATNHIRHCFDYLRRSIMCAADTNLEVVDQVNHTTNGWGQPKTCRDWNAVFEYAERYANSTEKNIVT